jgi:FkbM family methyltransferase
MSGEIKNTIHRIFQKTGYDFIRYLPDNFQSLKKRNLILSEGIDLVVDVGAHHGDYVMELRDSGYTGRVISFEPLSQSFEILQRRAQKDGNWLCIQSALGAEVSKSDIFISGRITSSSLLRMGKNHLDAAPDSAVVSKEIVDVKPLEFFLGDIIQPRERIFLKVDVQGYEMHVLRGANKLMKQIMAMEIELSFVPLYKDAPGFHDVLEYLEKQNYILLSLKNVLNDPNSGRLLQVDGLFRKAE